MREFLEALFLVAVSVIVLVAGVCFVVPCSW